MNYQVESRAINLKLTKNDCILIAFISISFCFGTGSIISEITTFKNGNFNYILVLVLFLLMFFSFYVSLDHLNKRGLIKNKFKSFIKLELLSITFVLVVCSLWFNAI